MFIDISHDFFVMFFMKGLAKALCGLVKDFKPCTLQEAISKKIDIEDETPKIEHLPNQNLFNKL